MRLVRKWERINRVVPTTTPLFWDTADVSDALVPRWKLTRIVTGIAMKELICHLDTSGIANMFILHDGVRHIVSFFAVRPDTTTSMVGVWSKATRSLQTFQASTTATHLFLRPPKGQNETLLGATDDYCVSSSRERAWQVLRASVAAKFTEYGARFSKDKWKSNVGTGD